MSPYLAFTCIRIVSLLNTVLVLVMNVEFPKDAILSAGRSIELSFRNYSTRELSNSTIMEGGSSKFK